MGAVLIAVALTGCGGALRLTPADCLVRQPANIVVLFRVDGPEGPVSDLPASAFQVTEDGLEVPRGPDLELSRPDLSAALRVLVLLDFGGYPSDTVRGAMIRVAQTLVGALAPSGSVAVYVFDGAAEPEVVVTAAQVADADALLEQLMTRASRDASTDLHSALLTAIQTLQLKTDPPTPHAGMLVLVTRGPDRAARVSRQQVEDQLDASEVEIPTFVVKLGPQAALVDCDWLATEPTRWLRNPEIADEEATALADRMLAIAQSYYLLSYCSGARSGTHRVTLAASRSVTLPDGKTEIHTGKLSRSFVAHGFGPGCTPWTSEQDEDPEGDADAPAAGRGVP